MKQVKCQQNQQNQEWNDTYTECQRTDFSIYEQQKYTHAIALFYQAN